MTSVAVSKLKAKLSEYLARAKAGEEVLVTERGRPVARIVPIAEDRTGIDPRLLELERKGLAKIGTGRLPDDFWDRPRAKDPEGLALKYLIEERREGR